MSGMRWVKKTGFEIYAEEQCVDLERTVSAMNAEKTPFEKYTEERREECRHEATADRERAKRCETRIDTEEQRVSHAQPAKGSVHQEKATPTPTQPKLESVVPQNQAPGWLVPLVLFGPLFGVPAIGFFIAMTLGPIVALILGAWLFGGLAVATWKHGGLWGLGRR